MSQDMKATPRISGWVEDIFIEKKCTLPCWEGITPGVTNIDEAQAILETNSSFLITTEPTLYNDNLGEYEIEWKTTQLLGGGIARSLGEKK